MVKLYSPGMNANAWYLSREMIFEQVRREHFPQKPSRFESIFLCNTEAELSDFRQTSGRVFDLAYEVEILDGSAPMHAGDWTVCSVAPQDNFSSFEQKAHAYWRGIDIMKTEVIAVSPVRVLRRC